MTAFKTSVKKCADCGGTTIVTNSREQYNGSIMRVRRCTKCGYTFQTYEVEECMLDCIDLERQIEALQEKLRLAREILER